ncbi:MAG: hypothetical protein RLZ72_916 [Actinomycetota bacterium]
MQILPGIRLTASKSGLGVSVGPRGAHISLNTSGRLTTSAGIPGSGLSYTTSRNLGSTRRPRRRTQEFAGAEESYSPIPTTGPAWAKTLATALFADGTLPSVRAIQTAAGPESKTALYVELMKFAIPEKVETRIRELFYALDAVNYKPSTDQFVMEHLAASYISVDIARGLRAKLSLADDDTWRLSQIEMIQGDELDRAIDIAEGLEPSTVAGASLAELYMLKGRFEDVVMLANDATTQDDAGAFLLVQRAIAFRELGRVDESHKAFSRAVSGERISRDIRNVGIAEWTKSPKPASGVAVVGIQQWFARFRSLTLFERIVLVFGLLSVFAASWAGVALSAIALGASVAIRRVRKG